MLVAAGADVDGEVVADVLGGGSTLRVVHRRRRRRPEPRALAPADVRHPIFQPFARQRGDARPRDVPERVADRRRRLPDAGPLHDRRDRRWSNARRATGARSCSRRISTTAGTIFRCTRRSCRSCTRRALSGERARARVGVPGRRRAGRRPARARDRDARATASRAAPRADRGQRRSARSRIRRGSRSRNFSRRSTRLKDAGGVDGAASKRGSRRIASTSGSTLLALMACCWWPRDLWRRTA